MAIVNKNTDFTGEYTIHKDAYASMDGYITKLERQYLSQLLGVELYNLFIADLTPTTPQTPNTSIYQNIFNPILEQDGLCIIDSAGIRKMLTQFIYFEYVRDQYNKNTIAGNVQLSHEISTPSFVGSNAYKVYNDAVDNYNAIQVYILLNSTDYPTFKGVYTSYIHSF